MKTMTKEQKASAKAIAEKLGWKSSKTVEILDNNVDICAYYKKVMQQLANGKEIMDRPINQIGSVSKDASVTNRRKALKAVLGPAVNNAINIDELDAKSVNYLANQLEFAITKGLETARENMRIPNDIKLTNDEIMKLGYKTKDDMTLRDYATEVEDKKGKNRSNTMKNAFFKLAQSYAENNSRINTFKSIKSLPLDVIPTKEVAEMSYDVLGQNRAIDVEAKYRLAKMFGEDAVKNMYIEALSIEESTALAAPYIATVEDILRDEIENIFNEKYKNAIEKSELSPTFKDDIIASLNIDNIRERTNKGNIHDVINAIENNLTKVVEITQKSVEAHEKGEELPKLTQDEVRAIMNIESIALGFDSVGYQELNDYVSTDKTAEDVFSYIDACAISFANRNDIEVTQAVTQDNKNIEVIKDEKENGEYTR